MEHNHSATWLDLDNIINWGPFTAFSETQSVLWNFFRVFLVSTNIFVRWSIDETLSPSIKHLVRLQRGGSLSDWWNFDCFLITNKTIFSSWKSAEPFSEGLNRASNLSAHRLCAIYWISIPSCWNNVFCYYIHYLETFTSVDRIEEVYFI